MESIRMSNVISEKFLACDERYLFILESRLTSRSGMRYLPWGPNREETICPFFAIFRISFLLHPVIFETSETRYKFFVSFKFSIDI